MNKENELAQKKQKRRRTWVIIAVVILLFGIYLEFSPDEQKSAKDSVSTPAYEKLDAGPDRHKTLYHEVELEQRIVTDEELIKLAKKVMKKNPNRPVQMGVYGPGDWQEMGYTVAIVRAEAGKEPVITSRNSRDFDNYPPEEDFATYWKIMKQVYKMYDNDLEGKLDDNAIYNQIAADYGMTPEGIDDFVRSMFDFVNPVF